MIFVEWLRPSKSVYGLVFVLIVVSLTAEIYNNANPDRLDWIDWWFWARQNLFQFIESRQLVGIVISPVQGLFGLSYPVSPFFNPLWGIAAIIDDPTLSHRISVSLIFVLYSATIWTVAKIFIHNKVFVLVAALISLNLFFNVVSVTEVYPLPKSNFNYFQLMPPQNFIFLLAIAIFVISATVKPSILKVSGNLGLIIVGVLADPFYSVLYFSPVILLIGIFYLLNIKYYGKEILFTLLGVVIFYFVGIFEYPLTLKDMIGRSVFNEYLFHHVKRHDDASFAFQNKQNLVFIFLSIVLLGWKSIVRRDRLAGSVLLVQILFLVVGFWYLSTNQSLNFLPGLHTLESAVVPLYVILSMHAFEDVLQTFGKRIMFGVVWVFVGGVGIFVLGKAITIDLEKTVHQESFSKEQLLATRSSDIIKFPRIYKFFAWHFGKSIFVVE